MTPPFVSSRFLPFILLAAFGTVFGGKTGYVRVAGASASFFPDSSLLVVSCEMDIPPPWHINSDSAEQSYLIVTRISLFDTALGLNRSRIYPKPVKKELMGQVLDVFEGKISFREFFILNHPAAFPVELVLRYQSCDDKMCYPPVTVGMAVEKLEGGYIIRLPEMEK